jgi:hypothetical protein
MTGKELAEWLFTPFIHYWRTARPYELYGKAQVRRLCFEAYKKGYEDALVSFYGKPIERIPAEEVF